VNAPVLSCAGVPLEGGSFVRVTYMDESGNSPKDPILIEAAVILHGDDQVIPVEERLQHLIEKHIPRDKRDGFYFHASDIYSGGDKKCIFFDKQEWPDEKRWAILDDILAIPKDFNLPIFAGIIERATWPPKTENPHSRLEIEVARHAMAIIQCEIGVELWLRKNFPNEITHIIAEDANDVRKAARGAHVMLKDPVELQKEGFDNNHPVFPFKKIRDGLQFTTKAESPLLQLADACAWSIFRAATNAPRADRVYRPLQGQMVTEDLPVA
jgi:hypothetical protein